jgi:geranylgeranylglycerol-phosphate geranylgeranyltransferase
MSTSIIGKRVSQSESDSDPSEQERQPEIIGGPTLFESRGKRAKKLLRSQMILFNSRKKWGLLFALATVTGLFCIPHGLDLFSNIYFPSGHEGILISIFLFPLSTLLIITGMYVLNDLIDADLDRANGKTGRPIPSGRVPKSHAITFISVINVAGISIPVFMGNPLGLLFVSLIALIGILYSIPRISLKDKFVVKTLAIAFAMMCSLLLGSSIYLDNIVTASNDDFLLPIFSAVIIALMVFVTSPLNDLGDIAGDKQAGRRTIPIVIGRQNTVKLSLVITVCMAVISWIVYIAGFPSTSNNGIVVYLFSNSKLVLPLTISFVAILTTLHLFAVLRNTDNQTFVRDSVTKKSIPLHILLQMSLVIGYLLF